MDYGQLSNQVDTIIKSAGSEGGTTSQYNELIAIDGQRELVVSHLKHVYDDGTTNMLNTKQVEGIKTDYKNLDASLSGSVADIRGKLKSADQTVSNAKLELAKKESVQNVLKILVITLAIVAALYLVGGTWTWIHLPALLVLLGGIGYAFYKHSTQ